MRLMRPIADKINVSLGADIIGASDRRPTDHAA
jgi:hypothetical protein